MWEFPNMPGILIESEAKAAIKSLGFDKIELLRTKNDVHIFTHKVWNMRVYGFKSEICPGIFTWKKLDDAALPTAFKKLIDSLDN